MSLDESHSSIVHSTRESGRGVEKRLHPPSRGNSLGIVIGGVSIILIIRAENTWFL
jgi:hypothetical protein